MIMNGDEGSPLAQAMILEVVENQLRDGEPPETKQTYNRLISEGHPEEDAKRLIACVVAAEVFDVLKKQEAFNPVRFAAALNRLPEFPEE
jgi:hypothetical protein